MMLRVNGLVKRGGVYLFRKMVPEKLRPIVGKREWKVSLGTSDLQTAQRRLPAVAAQVERAFKEAEAGKKNPTVLAYKFAKEGGTGPWEDHLADLIEDGHPRSELFTAVLNYRQQMSEGGEDNPPLSILFERYFSERKLPPKTKLEWTMARDRLTEITGEVPVRSVTRAHVRTLKDRLLSTPSTRTGKVIAPATAKKTLGAIRAVLQWALQQGYVEMNVAAGVSQVATKDNGAEDRRLPYTIEEARAILKASATEGDDRWLVLLGAYTGARQAELAGLRRSDVREEDRIPYISIQPHEARGLKNRSSRRNVPLHPVIIEVGFLTWVQAREDGLLFPGTSSAAGKRYSRWARKLVADKRKVFHSWRHTVKDRMRAARVPDAEQRAILGHAGNGVADAYGLGYPLKVLAEAVAKVTY